MLYKCCACDFIDIFVTFTYKKIIISKRGELLPTLLADGQNKLLMNDVLKNKRI